jgi:hypothetical protein
MRLHVKYTNRVFEKTVIYKRRSRNHLLDQVESFCVDVQGNDRDDDFWTPSATASRWLLGITKASDSSEQTATDYHALRRVEAPMAIISNPLRSNRKSARARVAAVFLGSFGVAA